MAKELKKIVALAEKAAKSEARMEMLFQGVYELERLQGEINKIKIALIYAEYLPDDKKSAMKAALTGGYMKCMSKARAAAEDINAVAVSLDEPHIINTANRSEIRSFMAGMEKQLADESESISLSLINRAA